MYLRAGELVNEQDKPAVSAKDTIKSVILEITKSRLGAAVVLTGENNIAGIITDGDIRRMLEKYDDFANILAKDVMSLSPKIADTDILAVEALEIMRNNDISQLIITEKGEYKGILHLHELVREGII